MSLTGHAGCAHAHHHHHDPGHAHAHHEAAHGSSEASSVRRLGVSLAVASVIMIAEALGGWLSGSLALISDAGHMLTDVAALALALLAVLFGSRPADMKRTFGFRRLEVLAAQINVGTLVIISGWIGWEAVGRLSGGGHPIDLKLMGIIATIGLAANLAILRFLQHEHGLNARSAFLHVLADTISSVAILLGAGAMALRPQLWWLDPVLSMVISALILWGAGRLVLEITDILMESVPRHLDLGAVTRQMECCDGVLAVHDLHIWTISSGLYALSAHVVVHADAIGRNDEILTAMKGGLRRTFGIDHTTIQIESADYAHVDDIHTH